MDTPLKILSVDDNPSIRSAMHFIFECPRYTVTDAEDGDDALARLSGSDGSFDVIIVDYKMPHLTGTELVDEIRKRGIAGKIIVLSAHLSPEVRDAFEQMYVNIIMEKPFDIYELRSTLDRLAA
jgi:two-component system response regulator (stage 0 sporulation protein F)